MAWIIDTAISKIKSKHWIKVIINIILNLIFCINIPNNESKRCPAIIFAVSRIASVNGRIINLIDSMITINGINKVGVPWGVKWESVLFKKLKILYIIILIHIFKDRDKQNLICLEAVKIYGNRPKKLE